VLFPTPETNNQINIFRGFVFTNENSSCPYGFFFDSAVFWGVESANRNENDERGERCDSQGSNECFFMKLEGCPY
jgi:hypothetical protein